MTAPRPADASGPVTSDEIRRQSGARASHSVTRDAFVPPATSTSSEISTMSARKSSQPLRVVFAAQWLADQLSDLASVGIADRSNLTLGEADAAVVLARRFSTYRRAFG